MGKPLYWTRLQITTPKPDLSSLDDKEKENVDKESDADAVDGEQETIAVDSIKAKRMSGEIRLWDEIDDEPFDETEFCDFFARQVVAPKQKEKKEEKVSKVKNLKVLDSKRSQNVGIFIKSQHLDIPDIENAVYNFDVSTLDLEILQQVYEVRAEDTELKMIKAAVEASPDLPLDKPDQFLLDLSGINEFADRIACFMFQATFEEDLSEIVDRITMLLTTIETLLKSHSIKKIFGLILTLGNYMNGGNRQRGQADGFGLEILPKIKDVKSKENGYTLLHFIVSKYIMKYEGDDAGTEKVQVPVPDPYVVEKVSNFKFEELEASLNTIEKELNVIERKTEKVIKKSEEKH